MDSYIPVTADSMPCFILGYIDESLVLNALDDFHRAINRVIIHHDDIE